MRENFFNIQLTISYLLNFNILLVYDFNKNNYVSYYYTARLGNLNKKGIRYLNKILKYHSTFLYYYKNIL